MTATAPGSRRIHLYLGWEAEWLQQPVALSEACPTLRAAVGNIFSEEMTE